MRRACLLLVLFSFIGARPAAAFVDAAQFFASDVIEHGATLSASAEGIYFTGAPRFAGLDCASCHTAGPSRVTMHLGASPSSLFTSGYEPGTAYELEVALEHESRGREHQGASCTEPPGPTDQYAHVPCNNNGFALELDAQGGKVPGVGTLCAGEVVPAGCAAPDPFLDETLVAPGGDAVFSNRQHSPVHPKEVLRNGAVAWHFRWIAPAAGTGEVTLYASAVDGNGGAGNAADDQDPAGDDTVSAAVSIPERGAKSAGGCSMSRADGPEGATACVVGVLLLAAWGRRASHRARSRRPSRPAHLISLRHGA